MLTLKNVKPMSKITFIQHLHENVSKTLMKR